MYNIQFTAPQLRNVLQALHVYKLNTTSAPSRCFLIALEDTINQQRDKHDNATIFKQAILCGLLSEDKQNPMYLGHYQYWGVLDDHCMFKHISKGHYIYMPAF